MPDSELHCRVDSRRGALVVAPKGKVDESTAATFGDCLSGAIAKAVAAGSHRLILDLGGITYMSSRGLRLLTVARREANDAGITILLAGANPTMKEILAISRYDQIFRVFARTEEALPE